MSRNFLVIDPAERPDVLRGLASPGRSASLARPWFAQDMAFSTIRFSEISLVT